MEKNHKGTFLLINTLPVHEQRCILPFTLLPEKETEILNKHLTEKKTEDAKIVVYGKNCNDFTVVKKQQQLQSLGFPHVYVYLGGMFEWLLLQDIYNDTVLFPTTTTEKDVLVFMPPTQFNKLFLG
jgi:hypothetical protein